MSEIHALIEELRELAPKLLFENQRDLLTRAAEALFHMEGWRPISRERLIKHVRAALVEAQGIEALPFGEKVAARTRLAEAVADEILPPSPTGGEDA